MSKTSGFSFGFAKTKLKTNIIQTEAFKDEKKIDHEKIELITSIEGKKVQSIDKSNEVKKPLVISCQKNKSLIDAVKSEKSKNDSNKVNKNIDDLSKSNANSDDIEAIKALIGDLKTKKEEQDKSNFKIPINQNDSKTDESEDANYETVNIEDFGLAALRGMGWNEKEAKKRSLTEPELRPKGLGLGAGLGKKFKSSETDESESRNGTSLKYAKGAYVEILNGKHKDEFGEIVGFDHGLNRILIKLFESDETASVLQNCTRLVSKSEYQSIVKNKKK